MPDERRSRCARETAAATMQIGTSGRLSALSTSTAGSSASTASGFTIPGTGASSKAPGASAIARGASTAAAAASHATTRHRGLGRWPSGNSRMRKTPIVRMPHVQLPSFTAAATSGPGTEPGAITRP